MVYMPSDIPVVIRLEELKMMQTLRTYAEAQHVIPFSLRSRQTMDEWEGESWVMGMLGYGGRLVEQ